MRENHRDLCSTCSYGSACTNQSTSDKRVLECEEFREEPRLPPAFREDGPQPRLQGQTSGEALKGLCSDCQNRKQCALRMSEGGVWHCEEYC
jgi:hypothetical protein